MPLILGGEVKGLSGLIRFVPRSLGRVKSSPLLRIVGEMFANAIARKQADETLTPGPQDLEKRVDQRTRELADANEKLKQEIADRQQAQEALCVSESRFRNIFDNSNDAIFVIDPVCDEIVDANEDCVQDAWIST